MDTRDIHKTIVKMANLYSDLNEWWRFKKYTVFDFFPTRWLSPLNVTINLSQLSVLIVS
ncbi:MAG: hypothetical protein LBR26_06095 [Prevotella sp.]|jgi:hypothetical protein|nr:hypothetical protein [Prevotella sp.]